MLMMEEFRMPGNSSRCLSLRFVFSSRFVAIFFFRRRRRGRFNFWNRRRWSIFTHREVKVTHHPGEPSSVNFSECRLIMLVYFLVVVFWKPGDSSTFPCFRILPPPIPRSHTWSVIHIAWSLLRLASSLLLNQIWEMGTSARPHSRPRNIQVSGENSSALLYLVEHCKINVSKAWKLFAVQNRNHEEQFF